MTQDNPWRRLSRRLVYENPWIRLDEDQVINPGGGQNVYGRVHFKNRAVGIIPLDHEGNTWLVGQYRYVTDGYSWEIPMGGSPTDETPELTARRELKEETGLDAERFELLMYLHLSNSITDEEGYVFIAEGLTEGETEFEETEAITVRKLPFREAVAMAQRDEIVDAVSVAGLLKLALRRPDLL